MLLVYKLDFEGQHPHNEIQGVSLDFVVGTAAYTLEELLCRGNPNVALQSSVGQH